MTPNYDAIRVAFATGNPVAARDDLIAAIQEAVEHSQHSGEAVRVIRRYLAAMDAGNGFPQPHWRDSFVRRTTWK